MTPIAASRCVSGRDLTEPRLSPDGSLVLAGTSTRSGPALVLLPVDGGAERLLTGMPTPRSARGLFGGVSAWTPDGSAVVYAATDGHLWCQPLDARDPWCVTGGLPDVSPDRPIMAPDISDTGEIACVVDMAEVWIVRVGGAAQRVDDGSDAFVADPVWSPDATQIAWQGWSPPAMAWDHSAIVVADVRTGSLTRDDSAGVQRQQPRWSSDGSLFTMSDSGGWLNLHCDGSVCAAEGFEQAGPTWGVGQRSYVPSPDGRHVAFTRNEDGFGRLCILDRASGRIIDVARAVHGHLDWRGNHLVALRTGGRTPTQVVVYDMATVDEPSRRTLAVGPVSAWDEEPALVEPELLRIPNGDATLHARLYRAPEHDGRLICWLHGGPTDQWQVSFMPRLAYWVSRGWSVLVPDHRGSTGHGRAYQQALRGRWGDLDVSDTIAVLDHAQALGMSSPSATVVMGSSAGGLTALGVVARRPDLVCSAAVAYPVCDIGALDDITYRFEAHYNDTLVGPRADAAARAAREERSPVNLAAQLALTPLLVLHGDADPVVPVDQSRRLAEEVRAAGGHVELVVYEGEGHGFRRLESQLDEYAQVTGFVARHAALPASG